MHSTRLIAKEWMAALAVRPRVSKRTTVYVTLACLLLGLLVFMHKPIYYFYYSNLRAYNVSIYEALSSERGPRVFLSPAAAASDDDANLKMQIRSEHKCACRQHQMVEMSKQLFTTGRNQTFYYQINVMDETSTTRIVKSYNLGEREFESSILTCSLFDSLRRGPNLKVVAYSLYGKQEHFYDRLKQLAGKIKQVLPDWTMRVYYDDSTVDPSIICQIECAKMEEQGGQYLDNADLCNINKIPYDLESTWSAGHMHGMMWRWLPIGDSFVDVFSSRDADSSITQREMDSTHAWLKSNSLFHIMRDKKAHYAVMLGGMWGFVPKYDRQLARKLFNSLTNPTVAKQYNPEDGNHRGHDQSFLRDFVWPFAKDNSTTHDAYLCREFPNTKPFPSKRRNPNCFVGTVESCDESVDLEGDADKFEENICPIVCRPQSHLDWLYC